MQGRVITRVLGAVVLLVAPGFAQETVPTAAEAATAVAEAHAAGDAETLAALAARDDPDPWRVAARLCARQSFDAAAAFATAAARPDTAALADRVVAWRETTIAEADLDGLVRAEAALAAGDMDDVAAVLDEFDPEDDFLATWARWLQAGELRALGMAEPAAQRLDRCRDEAGELGWRALEFEALRRQSKAALDGRNGNEFDRLTRALLALAEVRGHEGALGWAHADRGLFFAAIGKPAEALPLLELADSHFKRSEDVAGRLEALDDRVNVLKRLRRFDEAQAVADIAVDVGESCADRALFAQVLNTRGILHENLGMYEPALDCYRRAMAIYEELDHRRGIGNLLMNIGVVHMRRSEYAEAEEHFRRSLPIKEETNDAWGVAIAHGNLAGLKYTTGHYDEALVLARRTVELWRALGAEDNVLDARNTVGQILRVTGELDEALEIFGEALAAGRSRSDPGRIASALANLAAIHGVRDENERALELALEALAIQQDRGDLRAVTTLHGNIGMLYRNTDRFAEAREHLDRALELERRFEDRAGIGRMLSQLGLLFKRTGDYRPAREAYDEALAIAQSLGDRRGELTVLANLGALQCDLGDPAAAIPTLRAAYDLAGVLRDDRGRITALDSLGRAFSRTGDRATAAEHLERARDLARECERRREELRATTELVRVRLALGDLDRAMVEHERAVELFREEGDVRGEADAHSALADGFFELGMPVRAAEAARRAFELLTENGFEVEAAHARRAVGFYLGEAGRQDEARTEIEAAIAVLEDADRPILLATALRQLANIDRVQGRFAVGMARLRRALELVAADEYEADRAAVLGDTASMHLRRGEYADALACLDQATESDLRRGDIDGYLTNLQNRGAILALLNQHADALRALEQVLRLRQENRIPGGIDVLLINLGETHNRLGDHATALRYFVRLRELLEERGETAALGPVLLHISDCYDALRHHDIARPLIEQAVALAAGSGNFLDEMTATGALAESLHQEGRNDHRRDLLERALDLRTEEIERWQDGGIPGATIGVHSCRVSLLLELDRDEEAIEAARSVIERSMPHAARMPELLGGAVRTKWLNVFKVGAEAARRTRDPDALLYFLESGRAGMLGTLLVAGGSVGCDSLPDDLRKADESARQSEAAAARDLRVAFEARDAPGIKAGRRTLTAAREHRREVIERVQREARREADLVYPKPADLATLQSGLAEDQALVLYGLLGDTAMALVVEPAAARIVDLGPTAAVEALCRDLRAGSSDPAVGARADALAERVVAPLGLTPTVRRVLVSPEGALTFVPFARLLPGCDVACIPSATTWLLLREQAARTGEGVLAVGDPVYGTAAAASPLARRTRLAPLPATRAEVEAVGTKRLLGADATEGGFLAAATGGGRWSAVHLACHGLLDRDNPLFTSLALTPSEEDDGFLTLQELLVVRIPADLVVLSACETGRGREYKGEGVVGLTRAFMYAGAPRVVVSLWKVDDDATRALMTRFHALWKEGRPAAEALRLAQEHVRAQEQWSHPSYWAAWQLWGVAE